MARPTVPDAHQSGIHKTNAVHIGRRHCAAMLSVGAAVALLSGCATSRAGAQPDAQREPRRLRLSLVAAGDVNPSSRGEPAPIQVDLFELTDSETFDAADYFALTGDEVKGALGPAMLTHDAMVLRPGEQRELERMLQPASRVIGVVAGYRDVADCIWRARIVLPPAGDATWWKSVLPTATVNLRVTLQAHGIVIEDLR